MLTGSVADRNASVSSRLQQRHHEMEDLSNIRALLVKLQAVFELPQKLKIAQEQGAIEVAADKYDEVSELLRIYGHKVNWHLWHKEKFVYERDVQWHDIQCLIRCTVVWPIFEFLENMWKMMHLAHSCQNGPSLYDTGFGGGNTQNCVEWQAYFFYKTPLTLSLPRLSKFW